MPKLILITSIAVFSAFACAASAQDTGQTDGWNVEPDTKVDHFTLADADADGGINRTEFELYVSSRAEDGDAHYVEIKTSGDYDRYFTEKDVNADGLLAKDELTPITVDGEDDMMPDPAIIDDPDTIEE